jgi:hypothetical protein
MHERTLLYYVVSPTHLNNADLLATEMTRWSFRILYEPQLSWWKNLDLSHEGFTFVPANRVDFDPTALDGVDVVIMSTVQPRDVPLSLLASCLEREIPVVALEESNQLALNSERINNYLLPVDRLLVASQVERDGMISAGVRAEQVEVTGWPFLSDVVRGTPRESRRRLGLPEEGSIAALTLTALGDAGETKVIRARQLELARKGLPDKFRLVIKPHPIEHADSLKSSVRGDPRVIVLDGSLPVAELLNAADVLLNRGVSQVAVEALSVGVPVGILDVGGQSPFIQSVPEAVLRTPAEVYSFLSGLNELGLGIYRPFIARHIPLSAIEARRKVHAAIREIAGRPKEPDHWHEIVLIEAWLLNASRAEDWAARIPDPSNRRALGNLIRLEATEQDLRLLATRWRRSWFLSPLCSLRLRQLTKHPGPLLSIDLDLIDAFPPRVNSSWFLADLGNLMKLADRFPKPVIANVSQRVDSAYLYNAAFKNAASDLRWLLHGRLGHAVVRARASVKRAGGSAFRRSEG